jgi:signal transduction histidine kinase
MSGESGDGEGGGSSSSGSGGFALVTGLLATGVAHELAQPLRELREGLAVMIETIDRHVAGARGPSPLPWKILQALRQELADAYLQARTVARLASDLAEGVGELGGAPAWIDVNQQVEAALNLARHRVAPRTEIFVDLGSVPEVFAVGGELMLGIARLVLVCATSSSTVDGSALSVRTRHERYGAGTPDQVVVYVADNGAGAPAEAAAAHALLVPLARSLAGSFVGASEPGQGSVFELRIPAKPANAAPT